MRLAAAIFALTALTALAACHAPTGLSGDRSTCRPKCLTRHCGPDGCGGTCGSCGCAGACRDGLCVADVTGRWHGTYDCAQGETRLTLTIRGAPDNLRATFRFGPTAFNQSVPEGAFQMTGHIDCQRHLRLQPLYWIDRPDNYVTVGLDGSVSENGQKLEGRVDGSGCEDFALRRVLAIPERQSRRLEPGPTTSLNAQKRACSGCRRRRP